MVRQLYNYRKKNEISKDISAFANSAGGAIVYGVTESREMREPEDIDVGYDPSVISGEWLEQIINSRIERRIDGVIINTIALTATPPGRVLYVVYIPESNRAPHMAADDRFYKRFNFQSVAMKEYEVRNLMRREQYPSREVAIAWRDSAINPLLAILRGERAYLETKKWEWDIYHHELQGFQYLREWVRDSGDKEEFLELHAQVRSKMEEYDVLLSEVYARCNELFEQIRTSSFLRDLFKQCTTPEATDSLREKFPYQLGNSTTRDAILLNMFGDPSEEQRLKRLAQYIISEVDDLAAHFTTAPFWNSYGDKFRALTKYPPLSAYKQKAEDARAKLLLSVNTMLDELTKTRSEICRQHGIPVETPPTPAAYIGRGYGLDL